MPSTCPDCGRAFTRERKAVESITGRQICEDCRDGTLALGDVETLDDLITRLEAAG